MVVQVPLHVDSNMACLQPSYHFSESELQASMIDVHS